MVLFRGGLNDASTCPKSPKSHFIKRLDRVSCKMLSRFPSIPCLKRMYKCSTLVELMSLCARANKSTLEWCTHYVIQRHGNM
jgi:hypothetical protein